MTKNQNMGRRPNQVNWGGEVLRSFALIFKIVLRLLSYVLNVLLTILLVGLITGVIVGSAIMKFVARYGKDCVPYVADYVKEMKDAVRSVS